MTDLNRLAERVEQLSGPDREVDVEIGFAIGVIPMHGWEHLHPAYTASIDAAMSIVSEGVEFYTGWSRMTNHMDGRNYSAMAARSRAWARSYPLAICAAALRARASLPRRPPMDNTAIECHGLDTPERIFFYEQDFYVLSNFSSFAIEWSLFTFLPSTVFPTAEHLYHYLKFFGQTSGTAALVRNDIQNARSAHDAFKIAQKNRSFRRIDWDAVKVEFMRDILRLKVKQHEYVRRKLLATGDRELVENSWRDDFWGWGPNRDGQNMLGKLWMDIRAELRMATTNAA